MVNSHGFSLKESLSEETRLKLNATNKHKELQNEVERLQTALEEEEENKQSLQNKVLHYTQQVMQLVLYVYMA